MGKRVRKDTSDREERERVRREAAAVVDTEWEITTGKFIQLDVDEPERLARLMRVLGNTDGRVAKVRGLTDRDLDLVAEFARMGLIEAASRVDTADAEAELAGG